MGHRSILALLVVVATLLLSERVIATGDERASPPPGRLHYVLMYAPLTAAQAADLRSTYRALSRGGREMNPLLQPVIGSPAAMIALKGGVVALTTYANHTLSKKKPRTACVVSIAEAAMYGIVAAHNYHVAARLGR